MQQNVETKHQRFKSWVGFHLVLPGSFGKKPAKLLLAITQVQSFIKFYTSNYWKFELKRFFAQYYEGKNYMFKVWISNIIKYFTLIAIQKSSFAIKQNIVIVNCCCDEKNPQKTVKNSQKTQVQSFIKQTKHHCCDEKTCQLEFFDDLNVNEAEVEDMSVNNDPLGQTHSPSRNDHCFQLKFVLV